MSGIRWTTGVGIAVGGVGGALAALVGAPKGPPAAPQPSPVAAASVAAAVPTATDAPERLTPPPAAVASAAPAASVAPAAASAAAVPPSAAASAPAPAVSPPAVPATVAAPPLELPTTRDGLLKAEMLCDQRKDFDECARAAESLEKGTAGPPDPEQAKRFRRIALTHLVTQCESGAPHACFVLASKYRAGTELPASTVKAETLEQRGLELCKKRSAPECPAP